MMSGGSQQLRIFRIAIRDGASLEDACTASGISPEEARLHLADDAKNPPPADAYELIGHNSKKDNAMAKSDDDVTEIKEMDFKQAVGIYRADIAPEKTEAASHMQSVGEAYKAIKKSCHIQPQSAKGAIKAFEMEDAHRDDYLRGFAGMLNELAGYTLLTFHGGDLVDIAEGKSDRPNLRLATLEDHDDDADGEPVDDFEEATEEELAAQKPRQEAAAKKLREPSVKSVKSAPPLEIAATH